MNRLALIKIDILNLVMRFITLFTITSIILLVFTAGDSYIWKSLILIQASILSFLIRKYTKHIWSFIMLHLVLMAAYYMITDDLILRIVYLGYIIIFAIVEFTLDVKGKIKNTTLACSVLLLAMYGICEYVYPQERMLRTFFFYCAIIFGLVYILNMYYINFYFYLKKHEEKANLPLKQIKASNTYFIIGFLYLSFAIMLLFSRIPIKGFLHALGKLIIRFLRFVFSGLARKPGNEVQVPEEEIDENPYAGMFDNMEAAEPSAFWIAVSKVVITACLVIACALIIALIIYGLYRIYQLYHSKNAPLPMEEKTETISPFLKADINIGGGGQSSLRKSLMNLFGRSNNERIRKQYMKAVQKHTDPNHILKYKTPAELSKYAVDSGDEQPQELTGLKKDAVLTTIYEKARYSNAECSKEEVQSVKELLKG